MPADPRNPTREELLAEVLRLKRRIQVLETEPVLAGRTVIEGGRDAAAGESLLSLLRRTPDGHCTLDPGGRMLDVSESACALAGCSREEALARPAADWLAARSADEVGPHLRKAVEAGFDRYEGLLRTREDARVPVEVTLWLVDAGSGRLVAFLRDLSERKRHEDRLRFSEDLFRSAFSCSPVAMCLTLPDGRFGKVNKALCELLGYPEEELLARGFRDVTVKEDITASNKLVRDALAGKMQGFTLRKRYKHRAGKTIWANVSTFLRRDESGKPVYFITHIEDVTARVLAETERDQTMRDLVRSNTDLDRFARAASLQLEEPLQGLVACVRLLAERYGGKLDGEADNLLGTATDAAVRLQRFLRDLLVYSQAQSRGGQFRKVNPNRELAAAIQELRGAIEASKASVTADVLPAVQGDGPQIARLFQNLLDNAITFRGQESPRIRVSARIVAGFAEVSIADNGIGIPFEHRERVFGLFQRQDPTRKTAGSGIGLAMCKSIVERHGGRIWVESGPAAGSIFRFTLPLAEK